MKKNLLFGTCLSISLGAYAQISIVSTDMPSIGDVITNASDTMPNVTIGSAGANQTWNYSTLQNHNQNTMEVVSPASTPYAASFPTANIAFDENGNYSYGNLNSTEFAFLGFAGDALGNGSIVTFKMNPKNVMAQFSMDYNDSYTTSHTEVLALTGAALGFPFDSVKFVSDKDKVVLVDAWGMVTTPTGTYNTLRQKTETYEETTISALSFGIWSVLQTSLDTSLTYTYWSNDPGTGFPVAELDVYSGIVGSASFMVANPTVSVNNATSDKATFNVYPNPSTSFFVVETKETVKTIQVMDLTGKVVLTNNQNSNNVRVDVSSLSAGNYIIKAELNNGSVQHQSLEIVK